jgi:hypothetical protein
MPFMHYPIFPVYFPGSDDEGSVAIHANGNRMDVRFLSHDKKKKEVPCGTLSPLRKPAIGRFNGESN